VSQLRLGPKVANDFVTRSTIASLLSVGQSVGIAHAAGEAREPQVEKPAALETRWQETGLRVKDLHRPAMTLKEWMAQVEAATAQVTRVQLDRTEIGLEIVLDTQDGKPLQIDATQFKSEGNSLIAGIPNAVMALPQAREFSVDNPTADIANIRVTQTDAATIQVRVTGNNTLLTSDVTLKTGGLAYSLNPEGKTPEEELVVTGEEERGYRVPNANYIQALTGNEGGIEPGEPLTLIGSISVQF
jgi:hypothetical protein